MGGLLLGSPANQAIVPQMKPLDKSEEFYLGPFGDFTIGRDIVPLQVRVGNVSPSSWTGVLTGSVVQPDSGLAWSIGACGAGC